MSRVIIAPLFVMMMISGDDSYVILACFLYLLAAISDYIDGWYARKFNLETKWGKFFDPLADKVLTTACFIVFVFWDIMPVWMIVIFIFRDFVTSFMRIMGSVLDYDMATSNSAKIKTTVQMIFIGIILALIFVRSTGIFNLQAKEVNALIYSQFTVWLLFLLVLVSLYTLFEYLFFNKLLLSKIWCYFTKKKLANE
jgi:CDP-diacylglycerol--glycerol-3-phosphate 3-phosphatidyltransferase